MLGAPKNGNIHAANFTDQASNERRQVIPPGNHTVQAPGLDVTTMIQSLQHETHELRKEGLGGIGTYKAQKMASSAFFSSVLALECRGNLKLPDVAPYIEK